ncbi:delta1-piperideine-2-carboxylate reductase [Brevibacterium sanguinis]|uniref:Delta1-piperideine-2-carboxylate reductase n=2 Tax=Brevibacterium TaxID=1696 RepID=A0A366IMD0_9MICO|nr:MULTISPECIES: Ldh family oxidoreductase [Brevibacterium]RBP65719.1 delta1-piperideine-2-carboxylate reductase [Brevibacterium sanguinis]RBP72353.1 delta1-piperideine-2-carboxylate reductase [Brevibacterium celere]
MPTSADHPSPSAVEPPARSAAEGLGERISFEELVALIEGRLRAAGACEPVARELALNCASCERDGTLSHGVFRVRGYVDSLGRGWADGCAEPEVERAGGAFVRVDGRNGFSQPALAAAREEIAEAVREAGAAVVAIRDAHHFSALWPELESFARSGLVALGMIAGGKAAVIPPGARQRVFGTNPFGFATPAADADPVVFDFATSTMSHGDLQLHRNEGRSVPPGTGVDGDGEDCMDPAVILAEGGLSPFGGHKGALLSLMIETLAAGLTGAGFTVEIDAEAPAGAHTFRTGQLYIVIDPKRGSGDGFPGRVAELVGMLREAGMSRMPGDRRYARRRRAEVEGIPVTDDIRALRGEVSG